MHIHQQNHQNDIIFYWYQFSIGTNSIFPCDLAKYYLSPLNEMHIHQQNHWNDIIFYWYQSHQWYQRTIGIALYPARWQVKIILFPLMRCIFTNRTTGMTSFSIGTNRTIGTNGPSELPCTQPGGR